MTWETAPLGEVAQLVGGGTPSKARSEYWGKGVPWITSADIADDGAIVERAQITSMGLAKNPGSVVPPNSVVLVTRTGVGKTAITDRPLAFSQDIVAFAAHPRLNPSYLRQFLRLSSPALKRRSRGATILGVTREDVLSLRIPLPPLSEQSRIAAILDEADALRTKRSKSVALLDELPSIQFTSRQTTRWRQTTVGNVADLQGGLTVNARRTSLPKLAAYLRVANVSRGSIDLGTLKEIGVSDAELLRTRLNFGDVLVVEGHGNLAEVGRAAMVDHLPREPLTHQNHLFRLRARSGAVTGRFLELSINSPASRERLKRVANTTSGLNTLNATSIRNLPILVAPLDEQHEIEAEFAVTAAVRSTARHEQEGLDSLFASLQHRAFRGEL